MTDLSAQSAWPRDRVEQFLSTYRAPLRLAVNSERGFPMLCSLWFVYHDERILCATQQESAIARRLQNDPRCAFELAPNEPPYFGVRGRGTATLGTAGADQLLERLIERFLGETDTPLGRWLLGRADQEVLISIEPAWLTSWDFTNRMTES